MAEPRKRAARARKAATAPDFPAGAAAAAAKRRPRAPSGELEQHTTAADGPADEPIRAGGWINRRDGRGWQLEEG